MAARAGRILLELANTGGVGFTEEVEPAPTTPVEQTAMGDADEVYWASSIGGLFSCGFFALIASAISIYQIYQHAVHYEDPIIQRYFIRIIILVPNYALSSFFSLVFTGAAVYIRTARDLYEAFVIYSFLSLLLEFIGGPGNVEAFCRDKIVKGSLLYGTCCFPSMQVDGQFVKLCKRLVLQFVIVKPIITVLTIVLYSQGLYEEGDWSVDAWYLYIQIVYNFTYASALLGLIHFWDGTKVLLKPYKPVWKFVTVKGIVFITFWQGLVISLLFLNRPDFEARQLQTWLLCLEMVPAAVAMWFAFPSKPYMHAAQNREQGGIMMAVQNVGNVVMFTDVVTDLKHQFVPQYSTYTCYKDMEVDSSGDGAATTDSSPPARGSRPGQPSGQPTGQYRHATYVIRDPYQEQAIAESRQLPPHQAAAIGSTVAPQGVPVDLFGDLQDVPLEAPPLGAPPAVGASKNPFMTDLR